jgi:hypothetical protein
LPGAIGVGAVRGAITVVVEAVATEGFAAALLTTQGAVSTRLVGATSIFAVGQGVAVVVDVV